jgi:flagellar protein FlgJ
VIAPVAPQAPPSAQPDAKRAQLAAAAKAFEAVFLRQVIGSMRQASLGEDILGGGSAAEQFRDMQDARLADEMAEAGGGFGIADLLLKQFEGLGGTK